MCTIKTKKKKHHGDAGAGFRKLRVVGASRVSVCVPCMVWANGQHVQRPAIVGAPPDPGLAHGRGGAVLPPSCMLGQWPVMVHECGQPASGREPETGIATSGQTTDRAGAPEIQNKTASVQASWPETNFCRGGVPEVPHTHGGALLPGGHWSVVVPPVASASPMRSSGRCYPRSRTFRAETLLCACHMWQHVHMHCNKKINPARNTCQKKALQAPATHTHDGIPQKNGDRGTDSPHVWGLGGDGPTQWSM